MSVAWKAFGPQPVSVPLGALDQQVKRDRGVDNAQFEHLLLPPRSPAPCEYPRAVPSVAAVETIRGGGGASGGGLVEAEPSQAVGEAEECRGPRPGVDFGGAGRHG